MTLLGILAFYFFELVIPSWLLLVILYYYTPMNRARNHTSPGKGHFDHSKLPTPRSKHQADQAVEETEDEESASLNP